jgi:ribosomal-protein-alanine N-acetyltransferase
MNDICHGQNLSVSELTSVVDKTSEILLITAIELLNDNVVQHLPDHFKSINNTDDALLWYQTMQADARLFVIKMRASRLIIGYIFIYEDTDNNAYIGYLFGEKFWGQGFAKEALKTFIDWAKISAKWPQFLAGVEVKNTGSIALLEKLGFKKVSGNNNGESSGNLFYQLAL